VIEQARLLVAGRVRRQTLLSLLLLLILFASLVYGVSDSVRGIGRGLLWSVVLTGLPLGWLLAYWQVRGWLAALIALLGGVVPLFLYVGQLGGSLAALFGEAIQVLWQAIGAGSWPSAAPIQAAWAELTEGVRVLAVRLVTWSLNLVRGQPVFDPLPIAVLWGLALWVTAVWAGWAVRRRIDIVWAVLPATSLLAITLSLVGGRAWYLLPMLASMLVLRALAEYDARRRRWKRDGVRYAPRIRTSTFWSALGLSLALMVAAALTPSISVAGVVELARNLTQVQSDKGEIASSLGLERQPAPASAELTILDARRSSGLPTRHLIGTGPELSEQVVMVVSIESAPRVARQAEPSLYWRSLTYERYTGRGWSAEYAGKVTYAPGETTVVTSSTHQQRLRASVRRVGDTSELLYLAGTLLTADREYRVAWRVLPAEEEPGDIYGALTEADSYRVDSLLPLAAEVDLRAAGQDYPAWIVERYLALPDSVPGRVLALARDLTATELTPYDRALAIERYLRSFPYTLDLPSPPTDQDLVDYFLFDLQTGYCDYYATAMVVLARAAGLPARLVTGYASGTYDEARQQYVVTEAAAHAWAEIYFPGYGWIEFEPTASLPAIERPAELLPEIRMELDATPEPITARHRRVAWGRWLGISAGLLAMTVLGALVWSTADAWRARHLPPNAAVIDLYQRLYRYAPRLGASPRQGATPREFADALGSRLRQLAEGRHSAAWLDAAPREIRLLSELCTSALYSPHHTHRTEQRQAVQIWSRLRRRLWLARLVSLAPWRSIERGQASHSTHSG
jgi:transglutaminase-like putative cysteine protease